MDFQVCEINDAILTKNNVSFGITNDVKCNFLYGHDETRLGFKPSAITMVSRLTVESVSGKTSGLRRVTFYTERTPYTPEHAPRAVFTDAETAAAILRRVETCNNSNKRNGITYCTEPGFSANGDRRLLCGQDVQELIRDSKYNFVTV